MSQNSWADVIKAYTFIRSLSQDNKQLELSKLKEKNGMLYQEVTNLLEEELNLHPLLHNNFQEWDEESDDSLIGTNIGSFRLDEILGRGGMGSVFLGSRTKGDFDQKVAIKIIRPGNYSEKLLAQFKGERRILAGLNHPSIGRLYDGGKTEERMYFIMEYIEGLPLDEYVASNKLSIKERLELFNKVCEGISYAHNKLVLHLDLKPGNILITENGNPKILDFGISRQIIQDKSAATGQDPVNHFSIAYASPEHLNKSEVSIKSDIYSLGTLLFHLLTDQLPYGNFDMSKEEYLDARASKEFYKASRVSILDKKIIKGDLDNISQKALQNHPEDRYDSVLSLKNDIQAFLSGNPISLRKNDKKYVFGKFLNRHRVSVGLAFAALLTITSLVSYYTISLQQEKNKAQAEATKKSEVINLMTGLFAQASPYVQQGEQITVDTFMQNATNELLTKEDIDPLVKGEMLGVLGDVFTAINDYPMADSLLMIAEKLYQGTNALPLDMGDLNMKIGALKYHKSEYTESELYLNKSLEAFRGKDMEKEIEAYSILGHIAGDNGELKKADSLYRLTASLMEKVYTPPHASLAEVYTFLGISKRHLLEYDEAEKYYMKSLEMSRQLYEEPHTEIAYTYNHIASNFYDQGKYNEALEYALKGLQQREKILGPNHIETIASASNVARAMTRMKRYEEVIPVYRDLAQKMENIFGDSHNYVSATYTSLANNFRLTERLDSAMHYYDKSLDIFSGLKDQPNSRKGGMVAGKGLTYYNLKSYDEALPWLKENLDIQIEVSQEGSNKIGLANFYYGRCLYHLGEIAEARNYLSLAREILSIQDEDFNDQLSEISAMM